MGERGPGGIGDSGSGGSGGESGGEWREPGSSPPRWAERLLRFWLPRGVRDAVLGDMAEYHAELVAGRGRAVADRWYRWQALRSLNPVVRYRLGRADTGWPSAAGVHGSGVRAGDGLMRSVARDARYAVRTLRRSPGFTLAVVSTLGLGIGANTAIYSVVDAVLLEPLPFEDPEELALLHTENPSQGHERYYVSPRDFADWQRLNGHFEELAAFWPRAVTLKDLDGGPRRIRATYVTANFFTMLGVRPLLGRIYGPADGVGASARLILSHGFWTREFGGDPGVVGRTVELEFGPAEVIGVLPREGGYPAEMDAWLNIVWSMEIQTRHARWMNVMGRLEDGATMAQARSDLASVAERLEEEHPETNTGWSASVVPLTESLVGDTRAALLILLGATGLILLVACANIGSLLLSRAESRSRELAVRTALGASRLRLARRLLTESLILAGAGAALGLGLAFGGIRALHALAPPELPRIDGVGVDGTVLLVLLGSTVLTGLLFGLAPVARVLIGDAVAGLRDGVRSGRHRGSARAQRLLVVAQLALAVMLVVGAGLLVRSFAELRRVDPGFRKSGLVTFDIDLPEGRYSPYDQTERLVGFYDELLDRLEALPGVTAAGAATSLPLGQSLDYFQPFWPADRPYEQDAEARAWFREVSPGYFATLGIPLLEGRALESRDRLDGPGAVVVNEALARRYFPGGDAVGERITGLRGGYGPLGRITVQDAEIVGVVKDVRYAGLRQVAEPALYLSYRQAPFRRMTVALRTGGGSGAILPAAREAVRALDPDVPIANVTTVEELVDRSLARDRFTTLLLGLFAALALLLAAVGVYGVLAYAVQRRIREIGIRMALGASARDVRSMVLLDGTKLLLGGLALGLAGALAASRLMASQLFGVSARDPLVFGGVTLLLAAVALAASYLPALRATRADPVRAIRLE